MMVKELEKSGVPVVHITAMSPVSNSIGVNRCLQAIGGIASPMCQPFESEEMQEKQRVQLMERAIQVLSTDVDGPTVFYA